MIPALLLAATLADSTNDAAVAALDVETGWVDMGSETKDGFGPITARHKELDGVDCLEASSPTAMDPALLRAVVLDVPGNLHWSSADLELSRVLSSSDGQLDYVQVLNLPAPFSDRYWFLRGQVVEGHEGPGSWRFTWRYIDGAEVYPEALAELRQTYGDGLVEITVNVGSWDILPAEDGAVARFRSCTNVGGSVPRWAGEKAARMLLPNNITDMLTEAQRRAGG